MNEGAVYDSNGNVLCILYNDLINRLLWTAGEGNCSPVKVAGQRPGSVIFGTYYHAFASANLRSHFSSEEEMVRKACNAGAGHDECANCFVNAYGSTKPYFKLILNPSTWGYAHVVNCCFQGPPQFSS